MQNVRYAARPDEPAVLVEIYLPKKAAFQGTLFDTLTAGFRLADVRGHFLSADASRHERISRLIGRSWTDPTYTDDEIRRFPRIFFGYSLYDVDGVYLRSRPDAKDADDDSAYQIVEETSQVIRLVFKFPTAAAPPAAIPILKAALGTADRNVAAYAQAHAEEIGRSSGADAERIHELLNELHSWVRYVGLFVFGFVVYNLCERISSPAGSH